MALGKNTNIGSGFDSTTTLSHSITQQPLPMPATAEIVTQRKGFTISNDDDHKSEDDIINSEGNNNENEENVSSTMIIEPQSDEAPDYSTPYGIAKGLEDKDKPV